ncbi:hypothetical protein ACSSS7_000015 [Eimeria intestinalis]
MRAPTDQAGGAPYGGPSAIGVQPMGIPPYADDETDTRFFIIRSSTDFNVEVSMQRGIWATIPRNESRLAQAVQVKAPFLQASLLGEVAGRFHLVLRKHEIFSTDIIMENLSTEPWMPVDPDAGRALVYLFEEAFMAAGGGPPVFNPVYGGAPMGALGGPIGAPTSQHGHVVHHSQAPPQMQSQVGGPPQPVWQQQVLRVPEPNESQQKQRQQQSQGVGKEKKKHAGKRQEKSNATKNGTADEPLATTAPNNPAMRVFPIVLTEMTYDTYISAYEDSQALWQRVFKKHGYDVGEEERQEEEVHREAAPLQSNEPTGNQTPDEDFSTKTKKEENEGNKEGNLMQEDGLSVSPTAENDGKTTEPSKPSCGGAQENPFLQVKGEVEG